jgi:NAD(P)-dependent dehydrogenase (short-subunit alcohol dehydrogenase family)
MKRVWFITGSSRGLGRSLAVAVLKQGDLLAATSRRPEDLKDLRQQYGNQIITIGLDVTDRKQICDAVHKTIEAFGRIDVLVNNAGFGITGAAEGYTDEQVKSQLEVNLYAPIEVTRAVLPFMLK